MVTRKTAIETASEYIKVLRMHGLNPTKAILFGSYAKGRPRADSDIDLAIWDKEFTGCMAEDIEKLVFQYRIKTPPLLEIHTFNASEDEVSNPFIEEILKAGIVIDI
ncbi:MAG TPA: nucleotidyltransferase domain-containing protein [Cyclobacteriaceae bacterium]|nr:nucleotidyltransferase domain-containing protein [Cyclobacteriaceae bacterium]